MRICSQFGKCGGCAFQDIPYRSQLKKKKEILNSLLGGKHDIDIKVFFGLPFFYRNRMDFVFHSKGLGLREKGKWYKIVDVKECLIAKKEINFLLREVRENFKKCDFFDVKTQKGTFRYAVIRKTKFTSSISFVLNKNSPDLEKAIKEVEEFSRKTSAENVLVTFVPKNTDVSISEDYKVVKGSDFLKEEYLGKIFWYHVQGFSQTNPTLAEKMYKVCVEILKTYKPKDSTLIDLYGGVGIFGILSSEFFKKVVIVENDKHCVEAGRRNIKENKAQNVEILEMDAKHLNKISFSEDLFLITDPPRQGMHKKVISHINFLQPRVVLYVSCNPKKFAKDLKFFKNYKIKKVFLFDLFPHTPHFETVGVLERGFFKN